MLCILNRSALKPSLTLPQFLAEYHLLFSLNERQIRLPVCLTPSLPHFLPPSLPVSRRGELTAPGPNACSRLRGPQPGLSWRRRDVAAVFRKTRQWNMWHERTGQDGWEPWGTRQGPNGGDGLLINALSPSMFIFLFLFSSLLVVYYQPLHFFVSTNLPLSLHLL